MKSGDIIDGKYRLTERLGAGAMGAVWEAVNERTGRKVALKLILHPTDDLRLRLLREARACGSLNHPNIVQVYDVGEMEDGDPFLVMELLTGETLGDLLSDKRKLDPGLAARIGRDIASALAAAHDAKIIHRDLKPANIFLHREGSAAENDFVVKVLDFGVSKNLGATDGPSTVTGMVVGSPAYMSPEQVQVLKTLDHRTDIWSFGILLFEMLTGVRPFKGKMEEVVRQILLSPIPVPSSLVRNVPPELDEIVARCLERDRDKRLQNAKELSRLLAAQAEVSQVSRVVVNVLSTRGAAPPGPGLAPDQVPASVAGRGQMGSMPTASPQVAVERPGMGSVPEIVTASEMAVTLPLARREVSTAPLPMQNSAESTQSSAIELSPTGTQLMSMGDPIPSPMPQWRAEMQKALAASRQSSSTLQAVQLEDAVQGGTMALSQEDLAQLAPESREASTTSTTSAVIQPASARAPSVEITTGSAALSSRKKRGGGWLYIAIGVGVSAIGALALVFGMGLSSSNAKPERPAPSAGMVEQVPTPKEVEVPAPSATMVKTVVTSEPTATPAPSGDPSAAPSASAVASTVPAPDSPPSPDGTATPKAATPALTQPATKSNWKAPPKKKPCGKFLRNNCSSN